ncbi:hypothetical protein E8E12_006803 [Didymella heteroderae]|uniref:Uncharacterized protein n=1 Tax=Didymella heteroderae TaxID=1769908 RepID=A0A9P4WRC7_9PLEO|nr:hypothetical protein E8E12_006803 [Didymella heteroderae]
MDFTDAVIDFAIAQMSDNEEYSDHLSKVVYPLTAKDSPHRKLTADIAIKVWLQNTFSSLHTNEYSIEFLADLGADLSSTVRNGGVKEVSVYDFFRSVQACQTGSLIRSNTTSIQRLGDNVYYDLQSRFSAATS